MKTISPPTYNGYRPVKFRKIKKQYVSYRGAVISTKLWAEKGKIIKKYPYESTLERDLFRCLVHDLYCIEILPQAEFEFKDEYNKNHTYHVDCWAVFYDHVNNSWYVYIYEVKPKKKLKDLEGVDKNWVLRVKLLEDFCTQQNIENTKNKRNITWKFKLITEDFVYTPRFRNISKFIDDALIRPNQSTLNSIRMSLEKIYKRKSDYTYSNLVILLEKELTKQKKEISKVQLEKILNYLIYHLHLFFDWDMVFSNSSTFLWVNFNLNYISTPYYDVEPVEIIQDEFQSKVIEAEYDIGILDKEKIKEAEKRKQIIEPLIGKYTNNLLTIREVEKRAIEMGVGRATIYRWLKQYDDSNGNWKSLISKDHKRGNRTSKIAFKVNEIIQKHLTLQCEDGCKPLMKIPAKWENIKKDCEEQGYEAPSKQTVYKQYNRLPAKERKGTQGGFMEHEMPQSVIGKLSRGNYPLHFVQVDSTWLDIFVIDEVDGKTKRPFITTFIDSQTRMFFSYWLTLREHNAVDVNRGLMRGFLPKDDWLDKNEITASYPIHGIPHRLQFDNGKIFDTDQVRDFCFRYGVADYQFRMIKRPDMGGFVERMFRTINESWLSTQEGYAPPLKTRPTGYKPDKNKKLFTFNNFKKWFLRQVIKYHNTNHLGLKEDTGKNMTPLRMYEEQMSHRVPRLPNNSELLHFEVLMFKNSPLRPEGIVFKYNKYNSDGKTGFLRTIRARNRGEKKNVLWRIDPEDIREIWVFDDKAGKPFYFNVGFSTGLLTNFIIKYPDIPIPLRTYERVRAKLRQEGEGKDQDAEEVCKAMKRECKDIITYNKKVSSSKPSKTTLSENERKSIETEKTPLPKPRIITASEKVATSYEEALEKYGDDW